MMQITEYMYSGAPGEFVEFTNVGTTPIDMTGWSFDDSSRTAGSFSLSAFGIVQPGESVVLTEAAEAVFRAAWSLSASVKVIGGLTQNLGRGDEINLYDASGALVDRLTYNDQTIPGTIRTENASGWAPVDQLADQTIDVDWRLSTVNDAQNSRTSTAGTIGSPGNYNTGAPGILIIESGGSTDVTEGGATDTYTVVLRSQPSGRVTLENIANQVTAAPNIVSFDSGNWNIPQTFTVTAIDDAVVEGTHTGTINYLGASNYTTSLPTITVNVTDNDGVTAPPTIEEATATPFLDLATTGSGTASGVINDPTDPVRTLGIDFTIADSDTATDSLVVTVSSSNQAVVANANLNLTGTGSSRNLKITPSGVGFADVTVSVSDGTNSVSYVINYAASAGSTTPATTRFHTGTSDTSTAIAIDADYMLVADDEDQTIRLYDRNDSGLPLNSFDFTGFLGLSGSSEVDIEASTRIGNTIYWTGSHSNNSSSNDRPNRERIFATELSGSGANTTLTYTGHYQFLEDDLIAWDSANGAPLGLAASAASGVSPEVPNGFNIEGLTIAPDGSTAYIAFRAPNVPTSDRTQALIIPVTNFTSILSPTGGTAGSASFGAPIQLDLDGRGIRSIERNANNEYLIVAGPAGAATGTAPADFRLYTWTGNASDAPLLRTADLTALNADGSFESIVALPNSLTTSSQIQLLVDNGDSVWYNDGTISKDLSEENFQKYRSEIVTLGSFAQVPPVAQDDLVSTNEDTAVNFNLLADNGNGIDSDLNGDPFSVEVVDATGFRGTFIINVDGSGSFDPNGDFEGLAVGESATTSLVYSLSDGIATDTATVTFTVTGVNDAPVAVNDSFNAVLNTPLTLSTATLIANDTDVDGDTLSLTNVGNASNGTVSLGANGDVLFTPSLFFLGTATFDYTVSDGNGGSDTATVSLNVALPANAITGTNGSNTLQGNAQDNVFNGLGGNDTMNGNGGNDTFLGGDGNDTANGGTGNDLFDGGEGNDTLNGRGGTDTFFGRGGRDTLNGGSGNDFMDGGEGNDTLNGNGGMDTFFGGGGNDILNGSSGNDFFDGGADDDTINGNDGHDIVFGGSGNDQINTGVGNDTIDGGTGNDTLIDDSGANTLRGGEGNDTIQTRSGDDLIYGGAGSDTIRLGSGNDIVVLETGIGFDTIQGFSLGSTKFGVISTAGLSFTNSSRGASVFQNGDQIAFVERVQANTLSNNVASVFVTSGF